MDTPPTNGKQVCDHVLEIIQKLNPNRRLTEEALEAFTFAPGSVGRKNNKGSFQRLFEESTWDAEKKRIEDAARLHGTLCHLAAELRDAGLGPRPIDSDLLEVTGRVVRLACPGGNNFLKASAGTWCSWP
jgi:hypothetical protein